MAGPEAWQTSGRGDFDPDPVQHDGQEFGAMSLPPEFAIIGSTPLYGQIYQTHGALARVDHMNPNTDAQGVYTGVPTYQPILEFGVYGDAITNQAFALGRTAVSWESERNSGNAINNSNDFQALPFAPAGPPVETYPQHDVQPFAMHRQMALISSQSIPINQEVAFLAFDSPSAQQPESPFAVLPAPSTEAGSSVQDGWGFKSTYAGTSNSSGSEKVFSSYDADAPKSRPSSQNSNYIKSESAPPSPEIKASENAKNQVIVKDSRTSLQKPAKISPHTTERAHKSKVSKRKGKLNPEQRSKAAEMRKAGRCLRCALYKLGCDLGEPCNNCSRILNSPRSFRQPCLRADLKSIKLVRQCNGRFGQETVSFRKYRWELDGSALRMEIKWVLPGNVPIAVAGLNVPFKRYIPDAGDIDTTAFHFNLNGHIGHIDLPPYAVSDTAELMNAVDDFLAKAQPEVETWVRNRFRNDPLKSATFLEACRYRDQYESTLIAKAIQMQCGAVMSQGSGSVLNCNDIDVVDYRQFGYSSYEAYNRGLDRPLPQAIGHQFDVALLLKINEWQKDFLRDLKSKVFMSGAKPWYEIFLACFVLLSNLEYIYGGALAYAQTKLMTKLERQVSCVVRGQIAKWETGARVLLLYFRCVAKGHIPFVTQSLDPASLKAGGFDDDTIQYLGKAVQLLRLEAREPNYAVSPSTDAPSPWPWSRLLFSEDPIP